MTTMTGTGRNHVVRWFPLVLAVASAGMLAVLVGIGRGLTFWYDEWSIILDRADPSVDTLLRPHVDHLSIIPVATYQLLLRAFGLGTYWPYLAISWTCHVLVVALLYRIASRRSAPWLGLVAALSLLLLGSAFEDLLHAFQSSFMISVAGGALAIDRLSAHDRLDRRSLAVVVISLAVAVAASSVGVIFVGLILTWSILARRPEPFAIGVLIALAYAAWYLTWGRAGAGPIQGDGSLWQPVAYFAFGIGAAIASLVGLPPSAYAFVGAAIGLAAGVRGMAAGFRLSAFGIAAAAALLAQYALQAAFRSGLGVEHAARSAYLYPAVFFLWLIISDLAAHRRDVDTPRVRWVVSLALVLAIGGNLAQLIGAGNAMQGLRATMLEELRLIVGLRDVPGMALDTSPDTVLVPQVTPRRYLAAIDRFGEPQTSTLGGARPPPPIDDAAVNHAALELLGPAFAGGGTIAREPPAAVVVTEGRVVGSAGGCLEFDGPGRLQVTWVVEPGDGLRVRPGAGVTIALFLGVRPAEPVPVPDPIARDALGPGTTPPVLPPGRAWIATVRSDGPTEVCRVVR